MHAEPIDARSKSSAPVVLVYPYGIVADKSGHRFLTRAAASYTKPGSGSHATSTSIFRARLPMRFSTPDYLRLRIISVPFAPRCRRFAQIPSVSCQN